MADHKPVEVHICTVDDCKPIQAGNQHWFEPHMPCWICTDDTPAKRDEMMWNEHCEMFFHRSCLEKRTNV